ncbi:metallophosphoesterase family protein [Aliiroseovarius sediminis]|uniref:metallophosphoesterase family protein n=1 Tax=Aliiroseovarius sediminis TaxID=2925839 RepID=UPI001F55DA30|nr:metallophosphoesterase family protein [Aliiroseovarius sediminis]MCI2393986.1 serine/threonine protein phosphatase [Aliiroseovarius sediminis]
MRWIKRWTRSKPASDAGGFDAPIAPAAPFCAVGDIHGRADLLEAALARINVSCAGQTIVFGGDYIDRGPDSARVLHRLYAQQNKFPADVVCLSGNHEDMMLGFLDDPQRLHDVWLRNGGDATLRSFGVTPPEGAANPEQVTNIRDALLHAIGPELLAWLRNLPTLWQSGNVWVTHAGADPMVDMGRQDRAALLWGHPDFRKIPRSDGQWIVHGHTIVPEVRIRAGRISIDTGAYRTARLSVVCITDKGIEVLS